MRPTYVRARKGPSAVAVKLHPRGNISPPDLAGRRLLPRKVLVLISFVGRRPHCTSKLREIGIGFVPRFSRLAERLFGIR